MLPEFISKKVSNKIIFSIFVLMTLGSLAIVITTVNKVNNDNINNTKHGLDMLNDAIFQSLRNAMNTGDPAQIQKAEDEARKINGVKHLFIAKSKSLIEMYAPETKFTTDKDILKSFASKQNQILEDDTKEEHTLRMIKPMVASKECLMCHANQAEGDVIGVMDLTFSLKESDHKLEELTLSILIASTLFGWLTIGIVFHYRKKNGKTP